MLFSWVIGHMCSLVLPWLLAASIVGEHLTSESLSRIIESSRSYKRDYNKPAKVPFTLVHYWKYHTWSMVSRNISPIMHLHGTLNTSSIIIIIRTSFLKVMCLTLASLRLCRGDWSCMLARPQKQRLSATMSPLRFLGASRQQ